MTHFARVSVAALGLVGCVAWAADGDQPQAKPGAGFELRRAESKPAEGLTEATVEGTKNKVYLHKEVALTSADVAGARATAKEGEKPAVEVTLTAGGKKKFADLTRS